MSFNAIKERELVARLTTSAPSPTQLRHRRFFKNRLLRVERLKQRDEGEGESASEEDGVESESGEESSTETNATAPQTSAVQTSSSLSTIAPVATVGGDFLQNMSELIPDKDPSSSDHDDTHTPGYHFD